MRIAQPKNKYELNGAGKVINSSQDPNICFRKNIIEASAMPAEIRITLHGK